MRILIINVEFYITGFLSGFCKGGQIRVRRILGEANHGRGEANVIKVLHKYDLQGGQMPPSPPKTNLGLATDVVIMVFAQLF